MMPLVQLGAFREARWSVQRVAEVFSITDYTGDGVDGRALSLNLDLSVGGMVMIARNGTGLGVVVSDTVRGPNRTVYTNSASSEDTSATMVQGFTTAGATLGSADEVNLSAGTYKAFGFKKRARFLDIVTYTGDGTASRRIPHSLGATPGMVWIKRRDNGIGTTDWTVGHRSLTGDSKYFSFGSGAPLTRTDVLLGMDETGFEVGEVSAINGGGGTFVAYVFAHDTAGDGVIQCGAYTGNGSPTGPVINLGWQPQLVLLKAAGSSGGSWLLLPNPSVGSTDDEIDIGESSLLRNFMDWIAPTATGFQVRANHPYVNSTAEPYVYMAIRKAYGGLPNIVTPTAGGGALDYSDPQNSLYPHLF